MADFSENSSFGDNFDIAFYDNINGSSDIVFFDTSHIKSKSQRLKRNNKNVLFAIESE